MIIVTILCWGALHGCHGHETPVDDIPWINVCCINVFYLLENLIPYLGLYDSMTVSCTLSLPFARSFWLYGLGEKQNHVVLLRSLGCYLSERLVRNLVRPFLLDCVPGVPDRVMESNIAIPCGMYSSCLTQFCNTLISDVRLRITYERGEYCFILLCSREWLLFWVLCV